MGFYNSDEKIRYNLTYRAYSIINDDMLTFNEKTISSFIQKIFMNYKDNAEASISLELLKKQSEFDKSLAVLSEKVLSESLRSKVTGALKNNLRDQLKTKYCHLSRDINLSLRPRNDFYDYICSDECAEDKYYKNAGSYIQAIAEDYSSLPFRERELIVFKDIYEKIQFSLIAPHRKVRIRTINNDSFNCCPLGIIKDSLGMSNYVIGYININGEKRASSFKLSRIKEYVITNELYSLRERKEDRKEIEEELRKEKLPFLIGDNEMITVEFTDEGMLNYKKWQYNRPDYTELNGNTVVFDCSRYQATSYLSRFGDTAKVISPSDYVKEIELFFKSASENYTH